MQSKIILKQQQIELCQFIWQVASQIITNTNCWRCKKQNNFDLQTQTKSMAMVVTINKAGKVLLGWVVYQEKDTYVCF